MAPIDFSKKSIIFITGASRGIGRAISVEISRLSNPQTIMVLIASSSKGLEETKSKISEINSTLNVITHPLDLSSPSSDKYEKLFDDILKQVDTSQLEYSIFIHNAGTVGILKKTLDLVDVDIWRKFCELNVASAFILNAIFVKRTKSLAKKLAVINISSKCGLVPYSNMSMYGSAKAAREIYFKVFAVEEPEILVLNYCPGPVDTDMFHNVAENIEDQEMKKNFEEAKKTVMLQPKQTVDMMLSILQKGDFSSGDSVDYFDRV